MRIKNFNEEKLYGDSFSRAIRNELEREKNQRDSFLQKIRKTTRRLTRLAVIAERRDEKPISLDEMKAKLKQDGIL